jgi:ADP-heptose:LPS heptosyltransferase
MWRERRYDLGINFEPDIRSNLLLAAARPRWTAGYRSAGGGPILDQALEYDPTSHTSDNARRLAASVFDSAVQDAAGPLLVVPEEQRRLARSILGTAPRPVVAIHVSGGRPVKQWDPQRFADVAARLVTSRGATILLTGSEADRALIEQVISRLPARAVIDVANGGDLLTLAALLDESDLLITGDTGPMHLAFAVGTPIVAVFGPSDPQRYAPRGPLDRVVRVDLPCAPCNRIRLPPARCRGTTPDCLALVSSDAVFEAAAGVLDQCRQGAAVPSGKTSLSMKGFEG